MSFQGLGRSLLPSSSPNPTDLQCSESTFTLRGSLEELGGEKEKKDEEEKEKEEAKGEEGGSSTTLDGHRRPPGQPGSSLASLAQSLRNTD